MQENQLSFSELIFNASFLVQMVMLFLLLLSLVSWTIIIQRSSAYKRGRSKADEFEDRFWSGIDLNNLYQDCIKRQQTLQGLEVIYTAGFKEFVRLVNSGPADQEVVMDGTYRQMKVAQSREVEALESHLATLATIGSISPYIGLFGTVWGIMHAFVALAAVKNATLSMVAPPIAEALIATAMGLFAAIPAVMFYNHFIAKVEALENRYFNFMDEFATILNRRLVTVRSQLKRENEKRETQALSQSAPAQNPQGYQDYHSDPYQEQQNRMPPMHSVPPRNYQREQEYLQNNTQQGYQIGRSRSYDPTAGARDQNQGPQYITPGVAGDAARRQQQQQMTQPSSYPGAGSYRR
ncbi:MAG: protein TolQ [Succinivibrio sp.]|nr:protein TolQ [Succinivibrio sp.]